jgi:Family of unknown function (DUF6491)
MSLKQCLNAEWAHAWRLRSAGVWCDYVTQHKELAMKRFGILLAGFLLAQVISAVVVAKTRDYSERLALVTQFAGEPVEFVRFGLPRTAYDWEYLGDEAILIWHTRSKAYLVDLEKSDACRHLDREIAIKLQDSVNDLDTRGGYIDLRDGGWCKMTKIRPIDVAGLKKARKQQAEKPKAG